MQYTITHISARPRQLRAATAAVAALASVALLFGFATSASAETANPTAIAADAGEAVTESAAPEGAASVQPTPPPPLPVDAPEGVEAEAAAPAPSEHAPAASLPEIPVAKRVTKELPAVREEAAETIESVAQSAGSTAAAVDRAASADRLRALAHDPLRVAGETLRDVANGLLAREADESAVAPAAVPPDAAAEAAAQPAPTKRQVDPPGILHPLRPSSLLEGMPMRQAGESAGLALSHAESSSLAGSSEVERAPAPTPADAFGALDDGERFENLLPHDGDSPLPLPAPPLVGASGSGSSSFAPIVALLALLALAAPAILRRLREAPDPRAPTPFACALERPG